MDHHTDAIPMVFHAPIFTVEGGDIGAYKSVGGALLDLERWEVDSGAVRVFDAVGDELVVRSLHALGLDPSATHSASETVVVGMRPGGDALHRVLRRDAARAGSPTQTDPASLAHLIRAFIDREGIRG